MFGHSIRLTALDLSVRSRPVACRYPTANRRQALVILVVKRTSVKHGEARESVDCRKKKKKKQCCSVLIKKDAVVVGAGGVCCSSRTRFRTFILHSTWPRFPPVQRYRYDKPYFLSLQSPCQSN